VSRNHNSQRRISLSSKEVLKRAAGAIDARSAVATAMTGPKGIDHPARIAKTARTRRTARASRGMMCLLPLLRESPSSNRSKSQLLPARMLASREAAVEEAAIIEGEETITSDLIIRERTELSRLKAETSSHSRPMVSSEEAAEVTVEEARTVETERTVETGKTVSTRGKTITTMTGTTVLKVTSLDPRESSTFARAQLAALLERLTRAQLLVS